MAKRGKLPPAEKARRANERAAARSEAKRIKHEEVTKRWKNSKITYDLEKILHSYVPPSFKTPAEYAEALTSIQRANRTGKHQKYGTVGGAVRVTSPSLRNRSERNPRDVGFDYQEGKMEDWHFRRVGTPEEITRALYNENYYFHLPKRSTEYRIINRNVPIIRETLTTAFRGTPDANTYRMMCDAFYAFHGEVHQEISYMTRNTWKLYDILLRKANEIRKREGRSPIH